MLRRDIETILAAHRMDPGRRELYVEGGDEFLFLRFLAELSTSAGSQIGLIDHVDIPNVREGGNRARVLSLARRVEHAGASIRGLVDADNDWIIPALLPVNVWKTDGRDFESYFLRPDCFTKLGVAAGLGGTASDGLLRGVVAIGRELGVLRIVSVREGLKLPFQKTDVRRSVQVSRNTLALNISRYVKSLVQNAHRSIKEVADICAAVQDALTELAAASDLVLISGKDAMSIVDVALRAIRCNVTSRALLGTFERSMVSDYEVLSEVVDYLRDVEE